MGALRPVGASARSSAGALKARSADVAARKPALASARSSTGLVASLCALLLATAGAYAPRRPYPRGVRRQVRRAAEARPERSWTGRLWQPIRTLYKREQLLDDWSEMQAPRRTPRIKKLDRGANATWSERDQDAVARADMRAVDRDWKRLEKAIAYLPKDERAVVRDALIVAHGAHAGQNRRSGEPFVSHPVAVSILLADLSMDRDTVVAGLLHDTVEDTGATLDDIEGRYGGEVARLVNAVTKLDRLELRQAILNGNGNGLGGGGGGGKSASEAAELDEAAAINRYLPEEAREPSAEQKLAENLRKLVLAMSEDVRVLVIKLVDRLHNMRTLGYVASAESRQRKARETLQIYAPLADRIGMRRLAKELQALGFEVLQPAQAQTIRSLQALTRKSDVLATIERELNQAMARQGIAATLEVSARARDGQRPLPLPARRPSALTPAPAPPRRCARWRRTACGSAAASSPTGRPTSATSSTSSSSSTRSPSATAPSEW